MYELAPSKTQNFRTRYFSPRALGINLTSVAYTLAVFQKDDLIDYIISTYMGYIGACKLTDLLKDNRSSNQNIFVYTVNKFVTGL